MESVINAAGLFYSYKTDDGETSVLRDINLEIKKGEFTAILGRNGSGKSTFAKHLNAILLPSGGKVYIGKMDSSDKNNILNIRKYAGMVFQNPDNQLVTTVVEDDVAFAPENLCIERSEIRKRVDGALDAVGMSEYKKRTVSSLSGGEKQKIAIAGVLAMEPEIIILDESTAMLDPIGRKDILTTVKRLNREKNITVILITHYMEEAVGADRVIVMSDGEIILNGTPKEVFQNAGRIKSLGLDVPQVTELAHELKKRGLDIPQDILTANECEKAIKKLIGGLDNDKN